MIARYREPTQQAPPGSELTQYPPQTAQPRSRPLPPTVRTLAFALIVLAASYFVSFVRAPAIQFLALHLSYAAGLPWATSVACGITRDRVVLIVLVTLLVVLVAPNGVQALSFALVPVGAGLVAGNFAGIGIREERHAEPV